MKPATRTYLKWRRANPEKVAAHYVVNKHRENIPLQPCDLCGSEHRVHRHHSDYAEAFDFAFLCASCHATSHQRGIDVPTRMHNMAWVGRILPAATPVAISHDIAERIDQAEVTRAILCECRNFRNRERDVYELRIVRGLTLEQAGRSIGLTRERVRQLECKIREALMRAASRIAHAAGGAP